MAQALQMILPLPKRLGTKIIPTTEISKQLMITTIIMNNAAAAAIIKEI
jgi:hypothetical protein